MNNKGFNLICKETCSAQLSLKYKAAKIMTIVFRHGRFEFEYVVLWSIRILDSVKFNFHEHFFHRILFFEKIEWKIKAEDKLDRYIFKKRKGEIIFKTPHFSHKLPHLRNIKRRNQNEWFVMLWLGPSMHSLVALCAGRDRFVVWSASFAV